MALAASSTVLQQIRRLVEDECTRGRSDQDLLAQFARDGDETAFQALVRRQGTMVLDVCRAVLGNEADAEDAFQAAFLVLARKARSIQKTASLGCWLHGVAYRSALVCRRTRMTRSRHETSLPPQEPSGEDDFTWREAQRIVNEELGKLGEGQRAPLVLCFLQGKTQDEAARALGIAKSTLKVRLERARALLRARLVRRGLGPVAVLLASAWPAAAAPVSVPQAILGTTVSAGVKAAAGQPLRVLVSDDVAGLAERLLRGTLYARIVAAVVVVLGVCGVGCWLVWQTAGIGPGPAQALAPVPKPVAPESDIDRFVARLKAHAARRTAAEDTLGLFVMDLDKGDVALVAADVDHERAYCGSPCWARDGRRILFDSSPGMHFDKTRLQQLAWTGEGLALSSFGTGNCPTLSPDGKQVAFLRNAGAVGDPEPGIWVMQADGTARRRLGGYGVPRWSPDGRYLLVASFASPCKLSLLDVNTGDERPLEVPGHQAYSVPSWVDEATFVAVVRSQMGPSICLLELTDDGKARVKEVLWKRDDRLNIDPVHPVYSPKAKSCFFVGRDKQGQALYGFEDGKGAAPRRLETGARDRKIASLALSPDGRYLLFCSERSWPREEGAK